MKPNRPLGAKELSDQMVEMMEKSKIDPAIIYAFKKTGRLVSEANITQLSEEEIAEWDAAIAEYQEGAR